MQLDSTAIWPHLRAVLVAIHVVAIVLAALPAPGGGMNRSAWSDPTVQDELRLWNTRFAAVGVVMTDQEFQDELYDVARAGMKKRAEILKLFVPYYRNAGTAQSWRMFIAPHIYPTRMHIEVREGGEWRPVYIERSREHDWRSATFDQDRVRSLIFRMPWAQFKRTYDNFTDWVAVRARDDFPQADQVRVRFYKARSATPEQARAGVEPEGKFVATITRSLHR